MNSLEMKTYNQQEVSKIINVPIKNIKRWEKIYSGVLMIPRNKQGTRVYSELEISMLKKIKELTDNNTSRGKITEVLKKQSKSSPGLLFEFVIDNSAEPKLELDQSHYSQPAIFPKIEFDSEAKDLFKAADEKDMEEMFQALVLEELGEAPEELAKASEEPEEVAVELTEAPGEPEEAPEEIYEDYYEETHEEFETSLIEISPTPEISSHRQTANLDDFFQLMDSYKHNLLEEVKSEIRNGIRSEVIEEVKKEISKSSLDTVKSLSKSISRLKKNTKSELEGISDQLSETSETSSEMIKNLSNSVELTSHNTFKTFEILSTNIAESTEMTTEEIAALSSRISETTKTSAKEMKAIIQNLSNEISEAQKGTKNEISHLTESLNKDREMYIEALQEERLHFAKEIRTREAVFQNLVENFRNTASAKESAESKKWWKFWN